MAMTVGGGKGRVKSEINVTPLVDVVLVLLIIFMVVTPQLQPGKSVALPRADHPGDEGASTRQKPVVISVMPDRARFVGSDGYPDDTAFQARLKSELGQNQDLRFLIKADRSLSCGDVRKVLKLARTAGVERLSFGVETPRSSR